MLVGDRGRMTSGGLCSGNDRDPGRLDQSRRRLTLLKPEVATRVPGDVRGDRLAADTQSQLSYKADYLNFGGAARELVARADELLQSPRQFQVGRRVFPRTLPGLSVEGEAINIVARNPRVPTGGDRGFDLAIVDPSLDCRIAYAELAGGTMHFEQVHVLSRKIKMVDAAINRNFGTRIESMCLGVVQARLTVTLTIGQVSRIRAACDEDPTVDRRRSRKSVGRREA